MVVKYTWYKPSVDQVTVFIGTILGTIIFYVISLFISREGGPLLVFYYGCATAQDYYTSAFLCLALICLAAVLFLLPLTIDIKLAGVFSWGAAIFCIMNAFVAFEPSSGDLKEESAISAFKAVAYNDVESLSDLLNKKPEIIHQIGHKRNTLLHQAVSRRKPEIVSLLIEAGASIDTHNSHGMSAIGIAREINDSIIIKLIEDVLHEGYYDIKEIEEGAKLINNNHPHVPNYISEKLNRNRIYVTIMIFVNENGDVVDSIMLTPNPLVREFSIETANSYKFEPGKINKQPVKTKMTLTFGFNRSSFLSLGLGSTLKN